MSVRVLLVDDQPLMLVGLGILIGDTDDLEVVGQAGDGREAVRLVRELRPDVVVMDIRMPGVDGIEATRQATAEPDPPKVLVLTTFDDDEYVYGALRAGASGFLLKDAPPPELINAVRVVAHGESLLAPAVTRTLIGRFAERVRPSAAPASPERERLNVLTPREHEVLLLLSEGLSNAEIATALVISHETVKTYVSRILTKLDLRDRVQAVVLAYRAGLAGRGDRA